MRHGKKRCRPTSPLPSRALNPSHWDPHLTSDPSPQEHPAYRPCKRQQSTQPPTTHTPTQSPPRPLPPIQDSAPLISPAPRPRPPPSHNIQSPLPPTPIAATPPLVDQPLLFMTINTGGDISLQRFQLLLTSILQQSPAPPLAISLTEFRPCGPALRFTRAAAQCSYHLLYDAPGPTGGVGLLFHLHLSAAPPTMHIHFPGRLISASLPSPSSVEAPP